MSSTRTKRGRPPAPEPGRNTGALLLRGLTPADHEALDAATARARAALPDGATIGRTAVALSLLRRGLALEASEAGRSGEGAP